MQSTLGPIRNRYVFMQSTFLLIQGEGEGAGFRGGRGYTFVIHVATVCMYRYSTYAGLRERCTKVLYICTEDYADGCCLPYEGEGWDEMGRVAQC